MSHKSLLRFLLFVASIDVCAAAEHTNLQYAALSPHRTAAFIKTSGYAMAPMGFVRLCLELPASCKEVPDSDAAISEPKDLALLRSVNTEINHTISPAIITEPGDLIGEHWRINPPAGDCHDYVVTKKSVLIEKGLPAAALRIAIARTQDGSGHAVLVARTADGDIVLDNRTDDLRRWRATDLKWIAIQSDSNPRAWMRM